MLRGDETVPLHIMASGLIFESGLKFGPQIQSSNGQTFEYKPRGYFQHNTVVDHEWLIVSRSGWWLLVEVDNCG